MATRFHTVIVVPHKRAKLKKWRISNLQIGAVLGTIALVTCGSAAALWLHFSSSVDETSLLSLREENESLRQVNQSFETSLRRLREQLNGYEERTRKLAIVAGLENLADDEAGIGGAGSPGEFGDLDGYLASIEARASLLDGHLDQVEVGLEERQRWIASTPAITPVKGLLTSGYGWRKDPFTGRRTSHPGIDISAPAGRPVAVAADGIVVRAGHMGGLGKAVYVSHGFGITTRYGHLSRIDVKPGQKLRRGAVVGAVGSTGRSTGNHLHYEVRVDGKPVNPLIYLQDR